MVGDPREAAVLESWRRLAPAAGIDVTGFVPGRIWQKYAGGRSHVVMRLDGPGARSYVMKQIFQPDSPAYIANVLAAHLEAQEALDDHPNASVPRLLAHDRDRRVWLQDHIPGETLLNLCMDAADHAPHLAAAGAWLSAYHRATFREARIFQPHFMVDHIDSIAKSVEKGTRRIREGGRFVAFARQLPDFAQEATGLASKTAAKHGDMNCHNILIDGAKTAAFDFSEQSTAPVGYDIVRLLLNCAVNFADIGKIRPGQAMPGAMMRAFFRGYDFVNADDPGVQFLQRVQILIDWNRLSPRDTVYNLMRSKRIEAIAERAFARPLRDAKGRPKAP